MKSRKTSDQTISVWRSDNVDRTVPDSIVPHSPDVSSSQQYLFLKPDAIDT